jgi:hypothetical protein
MRKFLLLALVIGCSLCYLFSCTKGNNTTTTQYDTTVIKDTSYVFVKDTITLKDTIFVADPNNPITGTWAGVYLINGDAIDSSAYTFYIRPDNEVIAAAGGGYTAVTYSSGKWALNSKTFTTTLNTLYGESPEGQAITATYDSTSGTLIGTWVDVSGNNTGSGTLRLVRVP